MRVFISSTSQDLEPYRLAAGDVIRDAQWEPIGMEHFPADPRPIVQLCRETIHGCGLVILLQAWRFGWVPPLDKGGDGQSSITALEIAAAEAKARPVLAFLADDNWPGRLWDDDPTSRARTKAFRDELNRNAKFFRWEDDPKLPLFRALLSQELTNYRTAGKTPASAQTARVEVSRIDRYAPSELVGREAETQLLNVAWTKAQNQESKRPHVLTFVALGGEGKTSLVAKWVAELAHQGWPGCDAAFAWSFYSQGTRERAPASSDLFLKEALTFFGDPAMAQSSAGAFDKGRRLAERVGERRALLILDGLEPLQYAPTSPTPGELKDQGVAALLKRLAQTSHGLCVVTTRYSVPDLRAYWQTTAPKIELKSLSEKAGVALLRSLGVKGTQKEFDTLVADLKGHALTLNLIGTFLRDAHAGDIRRRDVVKLKDADATNERRSHASHVMDAYVQWMAPSGFWVWLKAILSRKERELQQEGRRTLAMLRLLGLFDGPAAADCLKALWAPPAIPALTDALVGLSDAQRNVVLTRLEAAKLLTVNRDAASTLLTLDSHPLVREYFAGRVREEEPETCRTAHRRLYEHLCATTKEGEQPTLEDLQPLYQAVAHGCQAGMRQEASVKVYQDRIFRGNQHHALHKFGAYGLTLGALACFFEEPWVRLASGITEDVQAFLINETAFVLRALGRLTEALDPMRAGLEMVVQQADWHNACAAAGNLSELALTLGNVTGAVAVAERAVIYADRSDAFDGLRQRVTLADALHAAGRRSEAESRFCEAEALQTEAQPSIPLLYSLMGFLYCDLLLTEAARGAWQSLLGPSRDDEQDTADNRSTTATSLDSCRAVSERAATALNAILNADRNLLDIGLNHLTLGRAALYGYVLESGIRRHDLVHASPSIPLDLSVEGQRRLVSAATQVEEAVEGLRRAGQQQYLPLGLLTRAWCSVAQAATHGLLSQKQAPDRQASAQDDLNEAFEIAERGPMPLFLADLHLYRGRLFHAVKPYPWDTPKADLGEARRLIEKHGYWRRKEELEDAEAAIPG